MPPRATRRRCIPPDGRHPYRRYAEPRPTRHEGVEDMPYTIAAVLILLWLLGVAPLLLVVALVVVLARVIDGRKPV